VSTRGLGPRIATCCIKRSARSGSPGAARRPRAPAGRPGPDPPPAQARPRLRRERRRLGERVEVPQRERQRDRLLHVDHRVVLRLVRGRALPAAGRPRLSAATRRLRGCGQTGECRLRGFSLSANVLCLRPGGCASARRRRDRARTAITVSAPRCSASGCPQSPAGPCSVLANRQQSEQGTLQGTWP